MIKINKAEWEFSLVKQELKLNLDIIMDNKNTEVILAEIEGKKLMSKTGTLKTSQFIGLELKLDQFQNFIK